MTPRGRTFGDGRKAQSGSQVITGPREELVETVEIPLNRGLVHDSGFLEQIRVEGGRHELGVLPRPR